jgi:hypothetical protein
MEKILQGLSLSLTFFDHWIYELSSSSSQLIEIIDLIQWFCRTDEKRQPIA